MDNKIIARLVIEIMGRPPEHIKESLVTLVEKIGSDKGVKILDKKYFDPKKIKEAENLYTSFVEMEVEFESLENFFGTIFNYMPANIEIISPEKFKLDNAEMNQLGNSILGRLHNYDAIAKQVLAERNILLAKLNELKGDVPKEIQSLQNPNRKIKKEKVSKKKSKPKKSKK